jgi:hypothetical protein
MGLHGLLRGWLYPFYFVIATCLTFRHRQVTLHFFSLIAIAILHWPLCTCGLLVRNATLRPGAIFNSYALIAYEQKNY